MAADRTSRSLTPIPRRDICCSATSCKPRTVPTPALCRFVAKLAVASRVIAQGPLAGDLFHLLQVVPVMAAHGFHDSLERHVAVIPPGAPGTQMTAAAKEVVDRRCNVPATSLTIKMRWHITKWSPTEKPPWKCFAERPARNLHGGPEREQKRR